MAGNIEAQIKPGGLSQRNLVDLLYMIVYSIQGICKKLDDDDTTDDTYEASVFTAIFNGAIEDSRGNYIMNRVSTADDRFFMISPQGIGDKELLECLYQIFDMMETLTEQLDADDATTSNYEALVYTAIYLWIVENCKGDKLGNGTAYYFSPTGVMNQDALVEVLYAIVDSIETLTEKLDTDAAPAGSDYEALWFTATVLMRLQRASAYEAATSAGFVGNDITVTP